MDTMHNLLGKQKLIYIVLILCYRCYVGAFSINKYFYI